MIKHVGIEHKYFEKDEIFDLPLSKVKESIDFVLTLDRPTYVSICPDGNHNNHAKMVFSANKVDANSKYRDGFPSVYINTRTEEVGFGVLDAGILSCVMGQLDSANYEYCKLNGVFTDEKRIYQFRFGISLATEDDYSHS